MSSPTPSTLQTISFTLNLPDPSLPPFLVSLTVLRSSLLLFIGSSTPFPISRDFAVSMPSTGRPSSTSLSSTTTSSLPLSAKLSKRYNRQVFLSLDLAALGTQGSSGERNLLALEKALLMQMDPIVKGVA